MQQLNTKPILNYLEKNNLSKTDFCKKCNISLQTLNNILTGKNFKFKTLFKIARQIDCYIKDFFND
ncbi:MAG: helix-turn-helix transcriptional regulator [Clostridia bacterium]|nr:helix-turn-helix transcriptional regulator [Clostridia bacterium]